MPQDSGTSLPGARLFTVSENKALSSVSSGKSGHIGALESTQTASKKLEAS